MTPEQISDYITRIVAPKIQAVPGVASASSMGSRSKEAEMGWIALTVCSVVVAVGIITWYTRGDKK